MVTCRLRSFIKNSVVNGLGFLITTPELKEQNIKKCSLSSSCSPFFRIPGQIVSEIAWCLCRFPKTWDYSLKNTHISFY